MFLGPKVKLTAICNARAGRAEPTCTRVHLCNRASRDARAWWWGSIWTVRPMQDEESFGGALTVYHHILLYYIYTTSVSSMTPPTNRV